MAKLTGPQVGQLQEVLLEAFDTESLTELLRFKLDQRLEHLQTPSDTFPAAVLRVIDAAESQGWLVPFLEAVAAERSALPRLQSVISDLLAQAQAPQPAGDEAPLTAALRPFEPETVLVPAGQFQMGTDPEEATAPYDSPVHSVLLPAFRIARFAITNIEYREFLRRDRTADQPRDAGWFLREPPGDRLDHPVAGVSWYEATAYCQWLSSETGRRYRLPSEAEWEKAASWGAGTETRHRYPWGDDFDPARCNVEESGIGMTTPREKYGDAGASPCGCWDMIGNVQEWTSTAWGSQRDRPDYPYPYRPDDGREDSDADDRVLRIHRGGSYRDPSAGVRVTARSASAPGSRLAWRGFRVVLRIE